MKTFLFVLAGIVLVVVALKLLPLVFVPIGASLGIVLLAATIVLGAIAAAVLGVFGLIAALVVALAVALAVLSPLWIPIALVVGMIALIRRLCSRSA